MPHPHPTPLQDWLATRGGIAHRADALEARFSAYALRTAVTRGDVLRIRRYWIGLPTAPADLTEAARTSSLLACVSAARHRGWWIPADADAGTRLHLSVAPHAEAPRGPFVVHWSRPVVPAGPRELIESVEDSLAHVAECLPHESALVMWESGARTHGLSGEYLRQIAWTTPTARRLAGEVEGLADSGLETIFVARLRRRGLRVRQQVVIAGHRVDTLIGDRLVGQIDGYAFHSSPADRGRDVAHDAELAARGYTVLRFTYAQVLHDWRSVESAIARALAAGRHRGR